MEISDRVVLDQVEPASSLSGIRQPAFGTNVSSIHSSVSGSVTVVDALHGVAFRRFSGEPQALPCSNAEGHSQPAEQSASCPRTNCGGRHRFTATVVGSVQYSVTTALHRAIVPDMASIISSLDTVVLGLSCPVSALALSAVVSVPGSSWGECAPVLRGMLHR